MWQCINLQRPCIVIVFLFFYYFVAFRMFLGIELWAVTDSIMSRLHCCIHVTHTLDFFFFAEFSFIKKPAVLSCRVVHRYTFKHNLCKTIRKFCFIDLIHYFVLATTAHSYTFWLSQTLLPSLSLSLWCHWAREEGPTLNMLTNSNKSSSSLAD